MPVDIFASMEEGRTDWATEPATKIKKGKKFDLPSVSVTEIDLLNAIVTFHRVRQLLTSLFTSANPPGGIINF